MPSPSQRLYLIAFPLGHLANDWAPSAIWLLAPAIALAMDLDPAEVGLLITLHSIGAALAYLPAGLLGDQLRRRGLLLAGTFWWVAIGYVIAASAPSFWPLALALGIAGMGDAAWHPIATGVMVQQMPERRAQALGVHAMGGTLAEVFAPLAVGFLLATFDWRTVLQLSVLPTVIMGIVFLRIARHVPPSREGALSVSDLRYLWNVWRRPSGLWMMLIVIVYNMALLAILSMMPLYLQTVRGHSAASAGVVFAATLLAGSLAQPLIGRLSDRVGRRGVTVLVLLAASAAAATAALADDGRVLVAALVLAVGLLVGVRAVILAATVETAGRRESTTLGLAFAIMDGVGALGAVTAGLIGSADLSRAFLYASALALASALMAARHSFATPAAEGPGRVVTEIAPDRT